MLPTLESPSYEVELISTNKKIKYRPFLVKEHKILMSLKGSDIKETARVVKELVDVCTFKTLDIDKLAYFDVEYLFMIIRSKSIGEIVDVNVNCDCGNKIPSSYNIDQIIIENKDNQSNEIILDKDFSITMRYPSIDETFSIFDNVEIDSIENMILSCLQTISYNGKVWDCRTYSKEELLNFIDSLSTMQFKRIDDFFKNSPQIVQNVKAECNNCGNKLDINIKGLYNFFL